MKDKITYARLKDRLAKAAGISRKEAHSLLKEMAEAIGTGLAVNGKVNLAGLGRFSLKYQNARRGRNPATGEAIDIPGKNRTHFLPEAKLRRYINRKYEQVPTKSAPRAKAPGVRGAAATSQTRFNHTAAIARPAASPSATQPLPSPASENALADTPVARPGTETSCQRKKPVTSTVILILLLAAAAFFLWPRPEKPVPVAATANIHAVPMPAKNSERTAARPAAAITAPATASLTPVPPASTAEAPAASPVSTGSSPLATYTVATGDSLWKISEDVYKYAYFWPLIFHENHLILKHPDTLKVGMRLGIPVFKGRVGRLTETDLQQLADGYFQVYQVYHRHSHPRAPYYLWVAYQLRAYWVPADELLAAEPNDLKFIQQLKGQGLIR